ncbi:MAG: PAS domain-containing sensor histidine kinase [Pseudomonadota bacterium]
MRFKALLPGLVFRLTLDRQAGTFAVAFIDGREDNPYGHTVAAIRKNPELLWEQIDPEEQGNVRDQWLRAATLGESFDITARLIHKDGKPRWARYVCLGSFDSKKGLYTWEGLAMDVTRILQAREELIKDKEDAINAHRTKSDFLARMSHELRTPLNAIIGFSDLMMNEAFGPMGVDRYKEYAVDINNSGTHLLALINDILDMSKVESGKYVLNESSVDVRAALSAVVRQVLPLADKNNLPLKLEVAANIPRLKADDRLVRQIVLNMLSNAVKFTPKGHVTVHARVDSANCIRISVKDTGIGMSEEQIQKALVPFGQVDSTLNRRHDGTGLGLALIQSFINLHGGRFDIRSTPGKGTEMTVRFPKHRCLLDA